MNRLLSLSLIAAAALLAASPGLAQLNISQSPLFESSSYPPMNMLVMGRDHTLFYQAYNDASDLTGDGQPDVGYKPHEIDYYGYFDSFKCYSYSGNIFVPSGDASNKTCGSGWSGDFLNWVTTARIDALRKVLYGGKRSTDSTSDTVLERSYIPQDAHSWGKEYQSVARDGYDIRQYTPLGLPSSGRYHLFANTSLTSAPNQPLMRVLQNTTYRVWEWVAIERPVAGDRCMDGGDGPLCTSDGSTRTDYQVRVRVCVDGMLEDNCQRYGSVYKPAGLLQEYGEEGRMHFGLISGSYLNNTSGGVLRKNVGTLSDEINPATGQFTDVGGIIRTIDSFRIVGLRSGHDYHPGWTGAWLTSRPMNQGEFPDWGNPVGEMVYESLRYFAGREAPTPQFDPGGTTETVTIRLGGNLELPLAEWEDPYADRPWCTRAAQLIISDVNPSYDTEFVPGSAFSGFTGDLAMNASTLGQQIWNLEHGGTGQHFIGESAGTADGAPTIKNVNSLGNIRGLAPEEPTKLGGYYAASAARHGYLNDLQPGLEGEQNLQTFAVALASPLPRIEFPVGNDIVTLVPFGKLARSTCDGGPTLDPSPNAFQPMAQIVDFFVETWANTHAGNQDNSINGGRPFARFRINFEDVEQAADHDMDGIFRYEVAVQLDGSLRVDIEQEYYAGCLIMNVGYVISGVESDFRRSSTQGGGDVLIREAADGLYLESRGPSSTPYFLNTPPQLPPNACRPPIDSAYTTRCAANLPLSTSRVFYPAGTPAATLLRDPLWYAAKYGASGNEDLGPGEDPENYFLVTNAATLAEQLASAFDRILQLTFVTGAGTQTRRLNTESYIYQTEFDSEGWIGDVTSAPAPGANGTPRRASTALPPPNQRNIFTWDPANDGIGREFDTSLPNPIKNLIAPAAIVDDVIRYIRGSDENADPIDGPFRNRPHPIGTIINSTLAVAAPGNEGWARLPDNEGGGNSGPGTYGQYIDGPKQDRPSIVYVGANDGKLHAFHGESLAEQFAFIPHEVLPHLSQLADPSFSHRFYVDGGISIRDARRPGGGWRTILVGSLGAGGRAVYALDITNPTSFSEDDVLWEFSSAQSGELGHTFGRPDITRLGNGQWVAIFGNGYGSDSGEARLFIVDLWTGEPVDDPDGYLLTSNVSDAPNGLSSPRVILNAVNQLSVNRIYAGDLHGNLWRIALDESGNIVSHKQVFQAADANGNPQPITGRPAVAAHPDGGLMTYIGTGKLFEDGDNIISASTQTQSFYAVRDLVSENQPLDRGDLAPRTLQAAEAGSDFDRQIVPSGTGPGNFAMGWYVDLAGTNVSAGERAMGSPEVIFGRVFFSTYRPSEDACSSGGVSYIYVADALTGTTNCSNCGVIELPDVTPIDDIPIIYSPPLNGGGECVDGPGIDCFGTQIGVIDPATGQVIPIGSFFEGRQIWRQAR